MKNKIDDNLSLFDVCDSKEVPSSKIDVVKLSYISSETVTWQDLFNGYDELYAVTFSSGINFVYALLDMFDKAEVIFGSEAVLSYTMQEIMAHQNTLLIRLREAAGEKRQRLLDRIDDESVRFYVSRNRLSHEKIYLLKATDGRKRVIMGSANMSFNAFGGIQRENICYMDDDDAFDWYMDCFNELKSETVA